MSDLEIEVESYDGVSLNLLALIEARIARTISIKRGGKNVFFAAELDEI